jgi:hypothetical protein
MDESLIDRDKDYDINTHMLNEGEAVNENNSEIKSRKNDEIIVKNESNVLVKKSYKVNNRKNWWRNKNKNNDNDLINLVETKDEKNEKTENEKIENEKKLKISKLNFFKNENEREISAIDSENVIICVDDNDNNLDDYDYDNNDNDVNDDDNDYNEIDNDNNNDDEDFDNYNDENNSNENVDRNSINQIITTDDHTNLNPSKNFKKDANTIIDIEAENIMNIGNNPQINELKMKKKIFICTTPNLILPMYDNDNVYLNRKLQHGSGLDQKKDKNMNSSSWYGWRYESMLVEVKGNQSS